MPLIKNFTYFPPILFNNGHIQTIYPSLFRKFDTSFYQRERISTNDNDFLEIRPEWGLCYQGDSEGKQTQSTCLCQERQTP